MAGISKKCYRPQKENMEKLHYYCLKKSKYLKKFLEKYQVEYKEDVYLGCYYFELSDANQAYKKFLRYFGIYLLGEYPQIQNHYSEEEMQAGHGANSNTGFPTRQIARTQNRMPEAAKQTE